MDAVRLARGRIATSYTLTVGRLGGILTVPAVVSSVRKTATE
ncbi:hypothetical protein [Ensifer sp. 4252]